MSRRDVVIIGSCGANLASLGFALKRLGVDAPVTIDPKRVLDATHVILPGVGAAGAGMSRLREHGFVDVVPKLMVRRLLQPLLRHSLTKKRHPGRFPVVWIQHVSNEHPPAALQCLL